MSRRTRVEMYNLLAKARQQLEQAQEIHQKLQELMAQIERDENNPPARTTKRKGPK